jgi:hypothetical protein
LNCGAVSFTVAAVSDAFSRGRAKATASDLPDSQPQSSRHGNEFGKTAGRLERKTREGEERLAKDAATEGRMRHLTVGKENGATDAASERRERITSDGCGI